MSRGRGVPTHLLSLKVSNTERFTRKNGPEGVDDLNLAPAIVNGVLL